VRPIGFSTGAVAYSDFERALGLLATEPIICIELSALRFREVTPLLDAIETLDLLRYEYVSLHAPSAFNVDQERLLIEQLQRVPRVWPIVIHPDVIHNWAAWREFGSQLAIENMDRRKFSGRTVDELQNTFEKLPDAAMCFDIGHARQCDPSMTEAYRILTVFQHKLKQIHISEVNTASQHDTISYAAKIAFQEVASLIPANVPVIIESRVTQPEITREICAVSEALPEFVPTREMTNA
jgi:hypothetical protein